MPPSLPPPCTGSTAAPCRSRSMCRRVSPASPSSDCPTRRCASPGTGSEPRCCRAICRGRRVGSRSISLRRVFGKRAAGSTFPSPSACSSPPRCCPPPVSPARASWANWASMDRSVRYRGSHPWWRPSTAPRSSCRPAPPPRPPWSRAGGSVPPPPSPKSSPPCAAVARGRPPPLRRECHRSVGVNPTSSTFGGNWWRAGPSRSPRPESTTCCWWVPRARARPCWRPAFRGSCPTSPATNRSKCSVSTPPPAPR